MFEYLAFRFHRLWRRQQRWRRRGLAKLSQYIELYIWGRWHQLQLVRRFVAVWAALLLIAAGSVGWQIHRLGQSVLVLQPESGGTFIEGEVGTTTILNPVLPQSDVSADVNSLIFDGLTKWGPKRQLEPDLAESWEVSSDARTYTFHLRHNVKWQDGVPFNAQDVLFTLTAIQDPDSRSPLASSWQGVQATAPDNYTVVFQLPAPYPPFIDSTTIGIVPRHLLENVDPSQLRTSAFNQHPVGTGPFRYQSFDPAAGQVILQANHNYFGGRPKLSQFEFRFYSSAVTANLAYAKHQVDAISQITPDILQRASTEPDLVFYDYALPSITTVFFNLTNSVLSNQPIRVALAQATDRQALINASEPELAIPASQPILPGQPGYTTAYRQDKYDPMAATKALEAAGWKLAKDGWRYQDGHRLAFTIVTLQGSSLQAMANTLSQQWRAVGVDLTVQATNLNNLEQSYIRPRNYQLLLYGITIGPDPDVYAYWHSSQISDPGLNLSEYQSPAADQALESGRLRSDSIIRAGKYNTFLQSWDKDQPAIVIATPIYRYGVAAAGAGMESGPLVEPSDRFSNVADWSILRRPIRR